jgi:hypothetical protein
MPIATPFNAPAAKGRLKVIKIRDGTDVAARYLVYKLYDAKLYDATCRCHLECESEPPLCQTYQHPAYGHRIPPLAATKGWHLASVQFPRHSAIAHKARCPEFLNHGCQSPGTQVGGNPVRQSTQCSTRPVRTSNGECRIAHGGVRVPHCR